MSYSIVEKLIQRNRSYKLLQAQGFVIHSTATPEATDENETNYFNNNNVSASVHYFVDYDSITRTVPENEIAWGCGPTGNSKYLQVEMCEFDDVNKFNQTYLRTVWLVADACKRYNWTVNNVFSHADISNLYKETDHTDPIAYLAKHGRSFDQMKTDIQVTLNALNSKPANPIINTGNVKLQQDLNRLFNANLVVDGILGNLSAKAIANAKSILGVSDLINAINHIYTKPTVKINCSDAIVTRYIQYRVGTAIDASWGPNTDRMVRNWQANHNLTADGCVGPMTWTKMIG